MILIRYILIFIIVFLITRSFFRFNQVEDNKGKDTDRSDRNKSQEKKISKEIGEYIDYEEVE
jgi:large-conductance mechanosensitive channel